MLSAALICISLLIAYVVVVGLVGAASYGITMLKPSFAVRDKRLSTTFNLLQDILWLISSTLGGYIVTIGALEASPRLAAGGLAILLLFVVWRNMDEARQRGMIHMALTSIFIIGGVATGYLLNMSQDANPNLPQ